MIEDLRRWAADERRAGHSFAAESLEIAANEIERLRNGRRPEHMCGLSGYNPGLGDKCPACEVARIARMKREFAATPGNSLVPNGEK